MTRLFVAFVLLFATACARAELVMTVDLTAGKFAVSSNIIQIKGEKIRADSFINGYLAWSKVIDLGTGKGFELDHMPKRIITNSPIGLFTPFVSDGISTTNWPVFQGSGATDNVQGNEANVYYRTNSGGAVEKLWLAKSFSNFKRLKNDLVKLDRTDLANGLIAFSPLTNMPLKLTFFKTLGTNGIAKMEVSLVLQEVKEAAVNEAIFLVPTNYHYWNGPQPEGDFFKANRELPNYSVSLDLTKPTNYSGIPPAKWFPMGDYEFCALQGTVATQIKLPDGKTINEDFYMVSIDRDQDGILRIRAGSLGWLKSDKAFIRLKRELNSWAADVLTPNECQRKEDEVQNWATTWNRNMDQFKGFFVRRTGYSIGFHFDRGVKEEDGFLYSYEIQLREQKIGTMKYQNKSPQPKSQSQ